MYGLKNPPLVRSPFYEVSGYCGPWGWNHPGVSGGTSAYYAIIAVVSAIYKYGYSNNTVTSVAHPMSNSMAGGGAAGNTSVGVFVSANSNSYTSLYTYASDTNVTGASLTQSSVWPSGATGNSTEAIIGLGDAGGTMNSPSATLNKYNYSANTCALATALLATTQFGNAVGNATVGIFCLGGNNPNTATNVYTYSGDTVAAGGTLTYGTTRGSAAGTTTEAIINSGFISGTGTATTSKYTYSSNTSTSGTSLNFNSGGGCAAGTETSAVFVQGYNTGSTTLIDVYTYSGDVVVSGTALSVGNNYDTAAVSTSNPGVIS